MATHRKTLTRADGSHYKEGSAADPASSPIIKTQNIDTASDTGGSGRRVTLADGTELSPEAAAAYGRGGSSTDQTMGDAFNLPDLDTGSEYDAFGKNALAAANSTVDQGKIRQNYISMFQDQINALNEVYDQQLSSARAEGVGRVGSGIAILARRGLGGSPRGEAIKEGVLEQNRGIESSIQHERSVAISAIFGKATELAQKEAADLRAAKEKGASDYISFIKTKNDRKAANTSAVVAALIAQGIDPSEMDTSELDTIAKQIGVNSSALLSDYKVKKYESDAAEAKAARDGEFNLAEGGARYDAKGNLIAERAKTYAPKEVSATDRKQEALNGYLQAFTPGATYQSGDAAGQFVLDENGLIKPGDWKEAIAEAPQYGISRKEFIETFGPLLYTTPDKDKGIIIDPSYGITPAESKIIAGSSS